MTTRREHRWLNRLRRVEPPSSPTNTLGLVLDDQYNQADQRRRIDNGDGTHWAIEYDDLGQMVSGKKYWPDGSAVPGQQFEYAFDDIGNRVAHRYGGDATGQCSKLREASYTANSLNQYTSRTNVSVVDLLGVATEGSVVSVIGSTNGMCRRGEYFHRAATNTANTWPSLTNVVSKSGTSATNIGNLFIPPTPEAFIHDIPAPPGEAAEESGLSAGESVAAGVGTSIAVYLGYRCLTLIPSLLPPLWPTLPVNIAVP